MAKTQVSVDLGKEWEARVTEERQRLGMKTNSEAIRHIVVNYFEEKDKVQRQIDAALEEVRMRHEASVKLATPSVPEPQSNPA